MDWRNLYPESRSVTREKIWSAVRRGRATDARHKVETRLSLIRLSQPSASEVSTLAAPGIASLMSDSSGKMIASNCGFTLMTGFGPDDILGTNCNILQHPNDTRNDEAKRDMRQAFAKQRPIVVTLFNRTKRGHNFCTMVDLRPVFHEGVFNGYVSIQACLETEHMPLQISRPQRTLCVMTDDDDFVERVRRLANPWSSVTRISFDTVPFEPTAVLIDNARIDVCRTLRKKAVLCPIFIMTSIHQPLNFLDTRVTGVKDRADVDAEYVRYVIRTTGQHIPPAQLPRDRPVRTWDTLHSLANVTETVSKVIDDNNDTWMLKDVSNQRIQFLSRLYHDSLVVLQGVFQETQTVWEYFELDAVDYVEEHGPPGGAWLEPVLDALIYLHAHGIVHRQIAAEHIFVTDQHVKLGGTRLAKYVDLGRTYTHCGVSEYVAPEIMLNKGYGLPVDIWAFGVLLFYVHHGTTPFEAEHALELYDKICHFECQNPCIAKLLTIIAHDRPRAENVTLT